MPTPSLGMYAVESPLDKSGNMYAQSANTFAAMQKKEPVPKKTVGGGLMSAAGGAVVGGQLAGMMGAGTAAAGAGAGSAVASGAAAGAMGGPMGIAIGAGIGALAYLFS